ncbi:hypothetical protein [Gloeocapsopsis dulcis]|uniref:Uncharacterized protein n=1 Tax=Gloeocapsopsis dulcis AAB1 = 1H9 TaxID=1433147 RepID=A0A6N8G372_9CHRO|nr:hypothetical protein [Gloeocapsopsis dulcis]MUL39489.1 hypothetical protein [Gloeocapsopsis dulcis AAB1 = 1H9]WNN87291.1 hypothetical protein P0S91_13180 [Gloeocapsopsis dulcis]
MKIAQLSFQQFPKIIASGLTTVATITALTTAMLFNAQAQIPSGVYEVQANGQIFDCALNNCGINRNVMPTPRTIG